MKKKKNRTLAGITVTPDQIERAENIGINVHTLRNRLLRKIPLEEAITRPLQIRKGSKRQDAMEVIEIKRIVGRIKYLNEHEEFPYPIPKPMRERMRQLDIDVEDIDPVVVVDL